jgi:ribosomal protein S1
VLRIEPGTAAREGRPKIALSIKAGAPDPWIGIETRFAAGARVQGVVARLTDFGAFVTLAPGVDGLVHISQAATKRIAHVKDVLAPGDRIEAVVLAVDAAKRRISLSIKAALEALAPAPAEPEAPAAQESAAPAASPAAAPPAEPTTMAIALRKALEEARNRPPR